METFNIIFIYLEIVNLLAFALMGIDKYKAKTHRWRIPEATLILFALIGGSIGSLAGMYLFHHKTRKPKFSVGVPAILVMQILFFLLIFYAVSL
jgi:uncharacterized membrane protein YsdA (DUF1294 family)